MQDATHIEIDSDESGFLLSVYAEGERHDFRIEGLQERLYDQAKARIGPYLRERDEARRTLPVAFMCSPDESGGYDLSDPKHENFHSVHADLYDNREGK